MAIVSFVDLGLLVFFIGTLAICIKRAPFYSFYEFTRFLLFFVLSFYIAKYALIIKPSVIPITYLQFFLLVLISSFLGLWFLVRFQKLFIFLDRHALNIDRFIYFHHLNQFLTILPSFIVTGIGTFGLFTLLVSFGPKHTFLQSQIESSKVKEIPYRIYFATGVTDNSPLFTDIVYTLTPPEISEDDSERTIISPELLAQAQFRINIEREKIGLSPVGSQPFISESEPQNPNPSPVIVITTPPPTPEPTPVPTTTPTNLPISIATISPTSLPTKSPTLLPTSKPTKPPVNTSAVEQQVYKLINQQRMLRGLPVLAWDENLAVIARAHSADMNSRGFFSHNNPDGADPFQRIKAGGITFKSAAENIVGTQSAELMVESWMNSEGHRKNILGTSYAKTGIGVVESSKYGFLGTQVFTD